MHYKIHGPMWKILIYWWRLRIMGRKEGTDYFPISACEDPLSCVLYERHSPPISVSTQFWWPDLMWSCEKELLCQPAGAPCSPACPGTGFPPEPKANSISMTSGAPEDFWSTPHQGQGLVCLEKEMRTGPMKATAWAWDTQVWMTWWALVGARVIREGHPSRRATPFTGSWGLEPAAGCCFPYPWATLPLFRSGSLCLWPWRWNSLSSL